MGEFNLGEILQELQNAKLKQIKGFILVERRSETAGQIKYKGMAHVEVYNGQTCQLWDDVRNGCAKRMSFPELYSFSKDKLISLAMAHAKEDWTDLFNLPLSVQAHT